MKAVYLFNIDHIREAAVALGRYAVNNKERKVGDKIHEEITEGRRLRNEQRRSKGSPELPYSSCGDLIHWLLMRLGCRSKIINRDEFYGWKVGVNLSRLYWSAFFVKKNKTNEPELGDILYVQSPDHVGILIEKKNDYWVMAEYGQPYGKLKTNKITKSNGVIMIEKRKLVGWIDLSLLPLEYPAMVPNHVNLTLYDNPYADEITKNDINKK